MSYYFFINLIESYNKLLIFLNIAITNYIKLRDFSFVQHEKIYYNIL